MELRDKVFSDKSKSILYKSGFKFHYYNFVKWYTNIVTKSVDLVATSIYVISIEVPSIKILEKDFGYNSEEDFLKAYKKKYIEDLLDSLKNDTTVPENVREALKNGKIPEIRLEKKVEKYLKD